MKCRLCLKMNCEMINMQLETKRLILREYTMDDFDDIYEILSDEETMAHYPKPFDQEEVKGWIQWNIDNYETFGFGLWVAELKENGQMIGDCGITMQTINGNVRPEIGYHIHKRYQNNGYATEAAIRCKNYVFENTPFNVVYSYMKHANAASCAVAVKNGMQLVDEYEDSQNTLIKVYAITRSEWENH